MIRWQGISFAAVLTWAMSFGSALAFERFELALIVNTRDPLSVAIGDYYAGRRGILFQNVIRVAFEPGTSSMTLQEFQRVKSKVESETPRYVQAYALAWAAPYRVDCMSITTAFAFGFDRDFCADDCKPTRASPYYDSPTRRPYAQLRVRPTMAIAATTFANAKALIDRGLAADGSHPKGTAYLLSTSDPDRNVRAPYYAQVEQIAGSAVDVVRYQSDAIEKKNDVLFYFTGRTHVEQLDTLRFLPGAIADHLTSAGGQLTDSTQMSALRWLEAGATGSYGAVVEPCSFPQKFPQPAIVIGHYLRGETLIEAYWKSVLMPGQGIFIGDPLAKPFGGP